MDYTDLIRIYIQPECLKEEGIEAQAKKLGDRVEILRGLFWLRRDYRKEALIRKTPGLATEHLTGYFEISQRYTTN